MNLDPNDPNKNFTWSVDNTIELPIRMKKTGLGINL